MLVYAEFVDRDNVGMIELTGHLRLLDKAEHLGFVGGVEHHLHGDVTLHRTFARIQDRAHAALRDLLADGVPLFPQQFGRKNALQRGLGGRETHPGSRRDALPADFQRHLPESDGLIGKDARGFGDPLIGDEGAIAATRDLPRRCHRS